MLFSPNFFFGSGDGNDETNESNVCCGYKVFFVEKKHQQEPNKFKTLIINYVVVFSRLSTVVGFV